LEQITHCPCCAAPAFEPYIAPTDYTVSQQIFEVVRCVTCGFLFTNPRPATQEIGYYYQSENYISHSNTNKGLISKLYKIVRNFALKSKIKLVQKYHTSGILLDIGCGTGEFLNVAAQQGFDAQGIEPDDNARNAGIKNYALNIKNENHLQHIAPNSVAVLTMWHVLEHVHQLQKRISLINNVLQKGGVAIVAVPNPHSYDAQHYKKYWAGYDVPRHLYHFTPQLLRQMFEKQGLKPLQTKIMPFDGFYVSLLSEQYKTEKMNYLKGFWIGLKSLVAAQQNTDKGSSQIYIFVK
jgi:ubiquinone/menaquinone biosynthesis C-methylase UbiE